MLTVAFQPDIIPYPVKLIENKVIAEIDAFAWAKHIVAINF